MFITVLIAAPLAAAVPSAAPAPAGAVIVEAERLSSDNQRVVEVADLDLGSSAGLAAARRRVGMAIAELCDSTRFSAADPHDSMRCTAETWAAVTPRLEALAPRLASR